MRNQVKHLLILISLLLLSSLLTSCEKKEETLYRWETSSGFEWKKFGEKGTQEKYEGEVSWSSKPNGVGTLIFLNGDKYIGEFDDGRKDGLGTYTWSNHEDMEKYVGEFTNGEFGKKGKIYYKNGQIYEGEVFGNEKDLDYGEGVKTLPDGSKYEGVWSRRKDDIISKWKIKGYDKYGEIVLEIYEGNGKGLYVYTGGNKYEGEFKDGEQDGQGTFTLSDGKKYVGEWKEGKWNGQGTFTSPDEYKYVGEWKDGIMSGQGTLTYSDGEKYVGSWKDGKKNGQGTGTYPNGDKYVGEWKDDLPNGQGTITYPNGNKYIGEWKDGERNGQGTITSPDGGKYLGGWKNGEQDGQGTFTLSDGTKFVGEWKDNKPWNVTIYDKDGNILGKYVNGKSIKQ